MNQTESTEVIFYTPRHVIRGRIALLPGARLTDYIRETMKFIAVTDVTVFSLDGKELFQSAFLNVNSDAIELAVPTEMMHFTDVAS